MPICVFCTYTEKSSRGTSMLDALNDKQRQKQPHALLQKINYQRLRLENHSETENWKWLKNTKFLELGKDWGSWLLSTTPPHFQPLTLQKRIHSPELCNYTPYKIHMEGRYLWIRFRVVSILSWFFQGRAYSVSEDSLHFVWSKTCNTPNSTTSSLSNKIWQQKEKLVKGMC